MVTKSWLLPHTQRCSRSFGFGYSLAHFCRYSPCINLDFYRLTQLAYQIWEIPIGSARNSRVGLRTRTPLCIIKLRSVLRVRPLLRSCSVVIHMGITWIFPIARVKADNPVQLSVDDPELSISEKLQRVRVATLVKEYLAAQELQLLGENGMSDAIQQFVEKDNTHSIEQRVFRNPTCPGKLIESLSCTRYVKKALNSLIQDVDTTEALDEGEVEETVSSLVIPCHNRYSQCPVMSSFLKLTKLKAEHEAAYEADKEARRVDKVIQD
jgi:Mre11 DNA-binding presumed domain